MRLTFGSLFGYAVIYTGWLKRATPQRTRFANGLPCLSPIGGMGLPQSLRQT
jgi:heme O synthase-like polyprenyltransferase